MLELNIPLDILEKFKQLSCSGEKTTMKDLSIIEEQENIKQTVSSIIDTTYYHYGNIFNHNTPFAIHSDISDKKKSILLIPIDAHKEQKFIVFDQTINQDIPISWIYNIFDDKTDDELKEMYYDTATKSRPYDTVAVKNCIDSPVCEELYDYLPYSKDLYYGLTGRVWHYTPGKALLFAANRIHATGKMKSSKIGCTIQFTASLDNLEILTKTHTLL